MRVTGGEFRGRTTVAPRGDNVRPTQDMVREALFSMLGEEVRGNAFLDLFAGSGTVGIEAASRGASNVEWVEGSSVVAACTTRNVRDILGASSVPRVHCCDVMRWLRTAGKGRAFEIVFADPPYDNARESGLAELAAAIRGNGVISPGGLFICEMPCDAPVVELDGWETLRDRKYGKSRLVIRHIANGTPDATA